MRRFIAIGTALILALLLFPPHQTQALTVSPPRNEFNANAGATIHGEFKLINEERQSKTLYFITRNFEAKDELGTPDFPEKAENLPTWIKIQQSITIGPKQELKIPYSITIPLDTEPGGYFGVIFASTQAPEDEETGKIALSSELGTLVLLRVNGELSEGADILEFDTQNKKHVFTSLPIDFMLRFQNSGESWVKPLGDIVLEDTFGKTVKIIPANPTGSNVLPKSIRRFNASWLTIKGETQDPEETRPPESPQGFWNKFKHEWEYGKIGRYTARVTLTYGSNQQERASATTNFWIIPWHVVIVVVPAALVALILLRLTIKRYNRFIIKKAQNNNRKK